MSIEKLSPRQDIIAMLGALCLFLSTMEYLVPKPLPFFRLGLANLPLLIGLRFLSLRDLLRLLMLKVLGQGVMNGTLTSHVFLFSLIGSATSLGVMTAVYRLGKSRVSMIGISLAGSMASSLVQLIMAINFIFGQTALVIAPLSLISSLLAGLGIGILAQRFTLFSSWVTTIETRYRNSSEYHG